MEGYEGGSHLDYDPAEWDRIAPLPKPAPVKKGAVCGECGMKFEYGKAYGYCCQNSRCPCGYGPR